MATVAAGLTVTVWVEETAGQNPPGLVKLKLMLKLPLFGKVTVNGPAPEPLAVAPEGHVQL